MSIGLDLSELHELRDRTLRLHQELVAHASLAAAKAGRDEAKRGKFKDRTGKLRRDIKVVDLTTDPDEHEYEISVTSPYARFVEEGTRPHDIRPKEGHGLIGPLKPGQSRRAKTDIGTHRIALRWEDGDGVHFAAVVHHQGSRPYPFMGPGYLKAEAVLRAELEGGMARLASQLANV